MVFQNKGTARFKTIYLPNGVVVMARVADTFWSRFLGYLPFGNPKQVSCPSALFFCNTSSVHTVGMRFPIDVYFFDQDFRVLSSHHCVPGFRFLIGPKGCCHTLEIPSALSR